MGSGWTGSPQSLHNNESLFNLYDTVIPKQLGIVPKVLLQPKIWPLPAVHGAGIHASYPENLWVEDTRRVFEKMPLCIKADLFFRN